MVAYAAGKRLMHDRAEQVSNLFAAGLEITAWLLPHEETARERLGAEMFRFWLWRGWRAAEDIEAGN